MSGRASPPNRGRVGWAAGRRGHLGQVRRAQRQAERLVDPLEHLVDAARLGPVAVLEVGGAGARHLEQRALERADRVGHVDLAGRTGQPVATGLAARGGHEIGAPQVPDELLEVGVGQLLALGDLGQRQAAVVLRPRQRLNSGKKSQINDAATISNMPAKVEPRMCSRYCAV